MGDGQVWHKTAVKSFFQTYSFSFTEPWLGGKKPVQFSTSISQNDNSYLTELSSADKSRSFNITGISVGIAKKLTVPDDYFVLSQNLSYQYFDLNNYNTGLFTFGDGNANNLAYTIGLSRNNTQRSYLPRRRVKFWHISKTIALLLFCKVDYSTKKKKN